MLETVKSRKGASIVAIVVILALLSILGVVFVSLFTTGVEESTGEANSTRALYMAEAGAEAAIGHLKKNPVSANWTWNDGYLDKAIGSGKADVEVLEYESRDSTLAGAYGCEPFESRIKDTGANPARTVYVTLSWSGAADLGLELYGTNVADCSNPAASASLVAASTTANMPERIRYRIPAAAPATLAYTARVTGPAGTAYRLRISHPDETGFSAANSCGQSAGPPLDPCMRAVFSIGKIYNARREIFTGFSRTP